MNKQERAAIKAEKAAQRAEKAAMKAEAVKKAATQEIKKDREEAYIIRKNSSLKAIRIIIWIILIFIFIKGLVVSIRPDSAAAVNNTIKDFRADLAGYKDTENEVFAFAQNFAAEYLTYKAGEETEYINRLKKYAADQVTGIAYKFKSGTSAQVLYAQAYKKENYSGNQIDVWVLLNVSYKGKETPSSTASITSSASFASPSPTPTSSYTTYTTGPSATAQSSLQPSQTSDKEIEQTILKVPVKIQDNRYIVEDLPVFVNDSTKIDSFKAERYTGKECDKEVAEAIKESLTNFFRAYCEDQQSVINYYLAENAKGDFTGLNKRVTFKDITSIRAYQNEKSGQFIVILTVMVIDKNGVEVAQNYNLEVVFKDKYYILSMNTRSINIKTEGRQ